MRDIFQAGWCQLIREARFLAAVLLVIIIGGLFVVQPIQRLYDEHFRPRPFMTAVIELVDSGEAAPYVRYATRAEFRVTGLWSAWVEIKGRRGCGGYGRAGYGPPVKDPVLWEWSDWLGKDCPVPRVTFAVCARYAIDTSTGVGDISGPFCSPVFERNGM